MESLTETELVRARWRRHLRVEALDTTDRADFARRGLANRVQELAFRLLILPYDPDVERFESEDAATHLMDHQNMEIGNGTIHFGTKVVPTAHATALVSQSGDDMPWGRYVAIHRNGAIELGLSDRFRVQTSQCEVVTKLVRLVTNASFTWATLELARRIGAGAMGQRHLLVVALPDTTGAVLSNLAVGYREPEGYDKRSQGCPYEDLLWHIELERLPADSDETSAVALRVASRLTNAWGMTQTLYLDRDSDRNGQLNIRRAKQ